MDQEKDGWVLYLRGPVDAPAVNWLELQRRLEELTVVAIDVRGLPYLGSTALPFLLQWARHPPSRPSCGHPGRQSRIR